MSLSRRQFGKAALTSAAPATTGVVGVPRGAWAADSAYVFAYFTESPNQLAADYGLHLAVSRDGLNWTPLNQNNPVVTPTAGQQGLRDPQVFRKLDGTPSQYLHAWDSVALANFTGYRRLRMHTFFSPIFTAPARPRAGPTASPRTPAASGSATPSRRRFSRRPTTAPRASAPTPPSIAWPGWPTVAGRRSGRTTSRPTTCGTRATCCASTRSVPPPAPPTARTRPSG